MVFKIIKNKMLLSLVFYLFGNVIIFLTVFELITSLNVFIVGIISLIAGYIINQSRKHDELQSHCAYLDNRLCMIEIIARLRIVAKDNKPAYVVYQGEKMTIETFTSVVLKPNIIEMNSVEEKSDHDKN